MMNDQHSQFEHDSSQNRAEERYSYVFSNGSDPMMPGRPPQKKGGRGAVVILSVLLAISIIFVSGAIGVMYAKNYLFPEAGEGSGDSEGTSSPSDLLHAAPAEVLEKSESSASIYGSAGEEAFAVSGVVRMVRDAVVVIDTLYPSTMGYSSTGSTGSGVIISDTGYILTCNHVVEDAASLKVTLRSGSVYTAALVGSDSASDLAVIKITPKDEEPLTYVEQGCSSDLVEGENVVAIGNPLGMGLTTTTGVISATERNISMSDGTVMTLIQTDAAINSGNSGGGLFNLDGQLIGIVNAKYSASGVEGLAFAIPIDSAYEVETQLIQYGYVRGVVDHGLTLLEVDRSNAMQAYYWYNIKTEGVYIYSSEYSAEFKQLDRIIRIGDTSVSTEAEVKEAFAKYKVGDHVEVTVERNGTSITVTLVLQEYVPDRLKSNNS